MTPVTQARPFALPPDVVAFAAAQGVDASLPAVLKMTQRLFPHAQRISLGVEDDPEIPDDRHLVIEVNVVGLDAEQYAEAKFQWSRALFEVCPATLVCVFRCALHILEA